MKNYKLLYNHLIEMLKSEQYLTKKYCKKLDDRHDLVEKIEEEGKIRFFHWILNEYLPELEGKEFHNIYFNEEEFKEWKIKVNNG